MKREDNQEFSLLETNSSKMSEEEFVEPRKKIPLKSVLAVLLVVALIIGVFVGGGLISEAQYQAELKKQEARSPRNEDEVRAADAPAMVEGEMRGGITTFYYTKENGMYLCVTFVNGDTVATDVTEVSIVLETEDGKTIASAHTKLKNVSVAAKSEATHWLYLEPHLVKITDDSLEKVVCTIEITDEPQE